MSQEVNIIVSLNYALLFNFLNAISSPSTYPCQLVSGVIISDLEIATTSPSFASLLKQLFI